MLLPAMPLWIGSVLAAQAASLSAPITTAEIAKRVSPAVVSIRATTQAGVGSGSGMIVDASGIIFTNLHVIAGATSITVKLPSGDVFDQVKVKAFDERKDLAIIQIPGFKLPFVSLGDSDEVEVGNKVTLIGNPMGLENSVSSGVISGIRPLEGFRAIQTDATANPGSSGGPLLNEHGKVIGILSFQLRGAESLNFAVPINYARGMLNWTDSWSLEEFSRSLGQVRPPTAAESNTSNSTTRWRSLNTGGTKLVRIDGEYVYVETVLSDEAKRHGLFHLAELKKEGDVYRGVGRSRETCAVSRYVSAMDKRSISKACVFETGIVITKMTTTRIEGFEHEYYVDERDCERCTLSKKKEASFSWIRE